MRGAGDSNKQERSKVDQLRYSKLQYTKADEHYRHSKHELRRSQTMLIIREAHWVKGLNSYEDWTRWNVNVSPVSYQGRIDIYGVH